MQLLYPEFLFALLALAIPIVIHLFQFRRYKKVYFTNVRFLQAIQQESQSKSKLKHLLVLFCRLLALAALVMAFCKPYFPKNGSKASKIENHVSIYVDNSFSMFAEGSNGRLFDLAKVRAREIVNSYRAGTSFQLLSNDFEGRHQRFYNKDAFLELLSELQISPGSQQISDVYKRQISAANTGGQKSVQAFIISDFQQNLSDLQNFPSQSQGNLALIPLAANKQANIYIDSCWLNTPVLQSLQAMELSVKIKSVGLGESTTVGLKLNINKVQRGLASVVLNGNSEQLVKLPFTINNSGWQQVQLSINDYPINFDNNYYFSFYVKPHLNIMCVGTTANENYFKALAATDSFLKFSFYSPNQLDYSALAQQDLIILNSVNEIPSGMGEELKKNLANGGHLIIFPAATANLSSYNIFLSQVGSKILGPVETSESTVATLDMDNQVLKGIFEKKSTPSNTDLPLSHKRYRIDAKTGVAAYNIINLPGNEVFLTASNYLKGSLYLFASPIDREWTNFAQHSLFAPVIYQIAMLSNNKNALQVATISSKQTYTLASVAATDLESIHLVNNDLKVDIIPQLRTSPEGIKMGIPEMIDKAGNYLLSNNKDTLGAIGLNFSRSESDIRTLDLAALQGAKDRFKLNYVEILNTNKKPLQTSIADINQGSQLWKWFILAALIFLLAELLLLKFFK